MSVDGLTAARRAREAADAAEAAKLARLKARMAWIRRAVLFPLILAACWIFWRVGYESGYLAALTHH